MNAFRANPARRFGVGIQGMNDALRRLRVSHKKRRIIGDGARRILQTSLGWRKLDNRPTAYIDEHGFDHDMPRNFHVDRLVGDRGFRFSEILSGR